MAFFAFTEGALAALRSAMAWLGYNRGKVRTRQILFLLTAAASAGEAALVEIAAKPGVDAAGGGQVRGLYRIVGGAAVLWGRQAVEGEGVVAACCVQSRIERLLRNGVR
jgi:hypothetical protein